MSTKQKIKEFFNWLLDRTQFPTRDPEKKNKLFIHSGVACENIFFNLSVE